MLRKSSLIQTVKAMRDLYQLGREVYQDFKDIPGQELREEIGAEIKDKVKRFLDLHDEYEEACRVLGVDPDAPTEVFDAAYRALQRHYHPDGKEPDEERSKEINRANDIVTKWREWL